MKLSATFIEWAWIAHFERLRYRAGSRHDMAEWCEGRRDALRSAAMLARYKEREHPSAGRKKR